MTGCMHCQKMNTRLLLLGVTLLDRDRDCGGASFSAGALWGVFCTSRGHLVVRQMGRQIQYLLNTYLILYLTYHTALCFQMESPT